VQEKQWGNKWKKLDHASTKMKCDWILHGHTMFSAKLYHSITKVTFQIASLREIQKTIYEWSILAPSNSKVEMMGLYSWKAWVEIVEMIIKSFKCLWKILFENIPMFILSKELLIIFFIFIYIMDVINVNCT
jgi:hypothetical protein